MNRLSSFTWKGMSNKPPAGTTATLTRIIQVDRESKKPYILKPEEGQGGAAICLDRKDQKKGEKMRDCFTIYNFFKGGFMQRSVVKLICLVIMTTSLCFGQDYWKRTFVSSSSVIGGPIVQINDSTIIINALDYNYGSGGWNRWFVSCKTNGDSLYSYVESPSPYECPVMIKVQDSVVLIAGFTRLNTLGGDDMTLMTLNKDYGFAQSTVNYGGTGDDRAFAMIQSQDGNVLLAGSTSSFGAGSDDIWVLKVKPTGDTIWTKTYGDTNDERAYAMVQTQDSNVLVAGTISSRGAGSDDIWLLKVNANGDTLWSKTFGGTSAEKPICMVQTLDGNILVAGRTASFGAGLWDIWLLKVKPNGDTIWTRTYGGTSSDEPGAMIQLQDSNVLVAGYTASFGMGAGGTDVWLLDVKPNGDTLWTKTLGGYGDERSNGLLPQKNGSVLLSGSTSSISGGAEAIWLVCIIPDQYARKDVPFIYTIPVPGDPSLYTYAPVKTPAGMTIGTGGTISWTPTGSAVSTEQIQYAVTESGGRVDTLTFNLLVNRPYIPPSKIVRPARSNNAAKRTFEILSNRSSKEIMFALPAAASSLTIYDIYGRTVQRLVPVKGLAVWKCGGQAGKTTAAGRYFARCTVGGSTILKAFSLVK